MTIEERALLQDEKGFLNYYYIFKKYVSSIVESTLRTDRETRRELEQQVWQYAWNARERFEGASQFKTWIFKIAQNTALDYFRRQKDILHQERNVLSLDDRDTMVRLKMKAERTGRHNLIKSFYVKSDITPESMLLGKEYADLLNRTFLALRNNHQLILIDQYVNDYTLQQEAEKLVTNIDCVKFYRTRARKALLATIADDKKAKELLPSRFQVRGSSKNAIALAPLFDNAIDHGYLSEFFVDYKPQKKYVN